MSDASQKPNIVLGLVGAVAGGVAGYFAFAWLYRQGFYGLILPPCVLGLAAGYCSRGRSDLLAIICGIAGLALGLFTEWSFWPFKADPSLGYFLAHVNLLKPFTLLSLLIGTICSYRFALGVDPKSKS